MRLTAKMTKDDYVELAQDYPYEVRKFHGDKHIMINGSPRRYTVTSFSFECDGKPVSISKARKISAFINAMCNVEGKPAGSYKVDRKSKTHL